MGVDVMIFWRWKGLSCWVVHYGLKCFDVISKFSRVEKFDVDSGIGL